MARYENAKVRGHGRWAAILVTGALCLSAAVGCGPGTEYDDARDAYQKSAEERAAADKQLKAETAKLSIPQLGTPTTASYARCSATPARKIGASHTVQCVAQRSVAYRVGKADASPDALWTAEKSAVQTVIDHLDQAGWDRAEWGEQLDQSLENRDYNPYPVSNRTEAKEPVDAGIYLIDRRWHEPTGAYEDGAKFAATLDGDDAGALVVVVFRDAYLTDATCDDCADREPTAWPSR